MGTGILVAQNKHSSEQEVKDPTPIPDSSPVSPPRRIPTPTLTPTQQPTKTPRGKELSTITIPTPIPTPRSVKNPMETQYSFQAGVNVVFYFQDPEFREKVIPNLERLMDLHINHISVAFPIYQDGYQSTVVYDHPKNTPKREDIAYFIDEAHKRGFTITLRPLMDEEAFIPEGNWRGSIQPTNPQAWFESYKTLITDYAQFAEEHNAEFFSIGSEFSTMESFNDEWLALITNVRSVYTGQITYSTNWDPSWVNFPLSVTPWKKELDFESIDAYFRLNAPDYTTVDRLIAAWQPWIQVITDSGRSLDSIVFAEIGIIPHLGAHRTPYAWESSAPFDEETQRRFYEATCAVFSGKLRGIHWWLIDLRLPSDAEFINSFNPLGRSAEQALAACYANYP